METKNYDYDAVEDAVALLKATLKDETDAVIPSTSLTKLTLTLWNEADGSIINSRNDQNVLNANNVTVDSSGKLAWTAQTADNPIIDDSKDYEFHVARFKFEYGGGNPTKRGYRYVRIRVRNMAKTP